MCTFHFSPHVGSIPLHPLAYILNLKSLIKCHFPSNSIITTLSESFLLSYFSSGCGSHFFLLFISDIFLYNVRHFEFYDVEAGFCCVF